MATNTSYGVTPYRCTKMTVAGGTSMPLRAWSHGRTQALVKLQHADATGYEMLGHSSIAITLSLHGHVTPHMQQQAEDTMDRVLGG
jgi:hypothetical protein